MISFDIGNNARNFIMQNLIINRPDDWHVHLRDGELLTHTVPASAYHFSRALIMPNLQTPLTSLTALIDYRKRILAAIPQNSGFMPYMTFYLNDELAGEELQNAAHYPFILGAKLYPAGATTNSAAGVTSLQAIYPILELLQDLNLALQIHGEVTYGDIFERESLFIDECLTPIVSNFPRLRIVLEHISTKAAVDFVTQAPANVAATITPHHLLYNRNKLLVNGLKPHYYCLPVLKHEQDQKALQQAAISGNRKFFAGTDSAPHAITTKENACGCAGIYSAPFALPFYAQLFDQLDRLDRLNDFTSTFGAEFYQLAPNKDRLELVRSPQTIPFSLPFGQNQVVPMAAGETIPWSVYESE